MSIRSYTIVWKGLRITADVYQGTTPGGGPDPDSIENLEVEIASESDLADYLKGDVYDAWCGRLMDEVSSGSGDDGRDYDSEREGK